MSVNKNHKMLLQCRRYVIIAMISLVAVFCHSSLLAQEHPPKPINISLATGIDFGTFFHGTIGGTVIISTDGSRSTTGDIFLVGFVSSPLSFWIEANPGTIISLLPIPEVTLTGNTGGSMTMNIDSSDPLLPFVTTAGLSQLILGGTLNVSNPVANPPGSYSATFFVTFNQE